MLLGGIPHCLRRRADPLGHRHLEDASQLGKRPQPLDRPLAPLEIPYAAMVPRVRIELTTPGFSDPCSTN
jgi:hypothetical protein